jgi:hydrogenase nickel incorporation protein HypA/HybF
MHEMSLAESVLQIIEDAASKQGFTRVTTVWLEIGQLACVEREAMLFCFDAAIRGSIAENARLEIVETAGRGQCVQCRHEFPVAAVYEPCPNCGSYGVRVTGGDVMRVRELEVE